MLANNQNTFQLLNMETKYFSVGRNGSWTNEAAPASFFESRGGRITDSRIESEFAAGVKTLWIDGQNVGKLFPTQAQQIAHLTEKGML